MKLDYSNIDAELLAGLDRMPPGLETLTRETIAKVRAVRAALPVPQVETEITCTEHTVATASGAVRVLVYGHPDREAGAGVLWVHGGGYVLGTVEDDRARLIAEELNCTVVSVDYRLAPEHPFPAGVEDCHASLLWMVQHGGEIKIDPNRIAIGGQTLHIAVDGLFLATACGALPGFTTGFATRLDATGAGTATWSIPSFIPLGTRYTFVAVALNAGLPDGIDASGALAVIVE